jgi:hypothetical protein
VGVGGHGWRGTKGGGGQGWDWERGLVEGIGVGDWEGKREWGDESRIEEGEEEEAKAERKKFKEAEAENKKSKK